MQLVKGIKAATQETNKAKLNTRKNARYETKRCISALTNNANSCDTSEIGYRRLLQLRSRMVNIKAGLFKIEKKILQRQRGLKWPINRVRSFTQRRECDHHSRG